MIRELLTRAVTFFRTGQFAYATLCFRSFMMHAHRQSDDGAEAAIEAYKAGDFLQCADLLDEVAKRYT